MLTSIAGRSVIVTGSSKGIGKGIAKVFAKSGGKVLVVSRHLDEAEACADELRRAGGTAKGYAADVTKLADMEGMAVMATNLKGTFLPIKACLPHLKTSDQGRIVITSSITGPVTGFPGWAHYGATKAGQLGFMRTVCIELAKYGITVNAVMPGNILTEGLIALGPDYERSMAASIPLKKLGTVEDIGYAALFLASKEAAYITGQTIIVDGGQILPESLDALAQA